MPEPTAAAYPAETEAPAEPAWSLSQDEWQQTQETLAQLAEFAQSQPRLVYPGQQQQDNQQQYPEYDPYDPQSLLQFVRSGLAPDLAPITQTHEQIVLGEAEERAMDILNDIKARDGDYDVEVARIRADALLPQMQEQYGYGPRAAEAALEQAAKEQRAYEQKLIERAVAQHTNQLATLAGAASEPGSTYTVGTQQRVIPDYRQGGTVTSHFFGPRAEQ